MIFWKYVPPVSRKVDRTSERVKGGRVMVRFLRPCHIYGIILKKFECGNVREIFWVAKNCIVMFECIPIKCVYIWVSINLTTSVFIIHTHIQYRRKKKCVKDSETNELNVSDITKNNKVTSLLGALGQESIQDSTFVTTECREDVIVSQTSQSKSSIIQAPITLQTIPT